MQFDPIIVFNKLILLLFHKKLLAEKLYGEKVIAFVFI